MGGTREAEALKHGDDAAAGEAPLEIHAQPVTLLAVGLVVAVLAVVAPLGFRAFGPGVDLANVNPVWPVVSLCLLVGLFGYTLYERHRTMRVGAGFFEASSWFGQHVVSLRAIGGISLRRRRPGKGAASLPTLVFRDRFGGDLVEVSVCFFPRRALHRLVARLASDCPDLQVDREVCRYLGLG